MRSEKDVNANVAAWQSELNKERAGALGLTAHTLEQLLDRCTELAAKIDRAVDRDLHQLLLRDYREARAESETRRWQLCVQREAIGLLRHDDVDRCYPIPPIR